MAAGGRIAGVSPRQVLPKPEECEKLCSLLTPKERQVITHVALGWLDKEIAARLGMSAHTVHSHIKNILGKLHCPNRTAAAVTFARGERGPE